MTRSRGATNGGQARAASATVAELFTKRNLWALAAIRDAIGKVEDTDVRDALMFGLTGITSEFEQDVPGERRVEEASSKGTYYIPQVFGRWSVTNGFDYKVRDSALCRLRGACQIDAKLISTQSASESPIPSNSVDYIFTDPPYAEKVQYGELNSCGNRGSTSTRAGMMRRSSSTRFGARRRRTGRR